MHTFRAPVSAKHPHIEALLARHAMLDQKIQDARKYPSTDGIELRQLKSQKLKIKDEILQQGHMTG